MALIFLFRFFLFKYCLKYTANIQSVKIKENNLEGKEIEMKVQLHLVVKNKTLIRFNTQEAVKKTKQFFKAFVINVSIKQFIQ